MPVAERASHLRRKSEPAVKTASSKLITLNIEDFSCIRAAKFELAPVTVLIGPQGSGKSLTIKLFYFFIDIFSRQIVSSERDLDIDEFKRETVRLFKTWFPPGAWGKRRFNITFAAGPYQFRILRRMSKGNVADDVTVTFSDRFKSQYDSLLESYRKNRDQITDRSELLHRSTEASWHIRGRFHAALTSELGPLFIESQTFVPAGRAFFTSIGRLVAAIEQGSSLDPVTIRFAKLFANLRDFASKGALFGRSSSQDNAQRRKMMIDLFGGEIKFERDLEFVETQDGRRVPFTALSSGQQELLPMWLLIDFYAGRQPERDRSSDLFYIEEPEAHLFPEAQSLLVDFLIGHLVSKRARRNLIITTHSPYILAKLNNFLKAGSLGRTRRNAEAVDEIVSREYWLTPKRLKAYSIHDGLMNDLMDEEGLIDARYIDEVSNSVGETFSKLLDIEFPEVGS
ncbi:AAA family ATPase [Sphingomonas sp.]|jgi:hypothetical protein|uniref:AAA family ATPase n=1 Tax=Sphingomonas sp. TaxID=28214 RepID=UPI00356AA1B3